MPPTQLHTLITLAATLMSRTNTIFDGGAFGPQTMELLESLDPHPERRHQCAISNLLASRRRSIWRVKVGDFEVRGSNPET